MSDAHQPLSTGTASADIRETVDSLYRAESTPGARHADPAAG